MQITSSNANKFALVKGKIVGYLLNPLTLKSD